MKSPLVSLRGLMIPVAACALAAPLAAATAYVPALDGAVRADGSRSETELWISNGGEAPSFFDLEGPRTQVPARASKAVRVPGRAGDSLLTLELGSGVAATANLLTTAASGAVSAAPLPVFAPGDALPASTTANLAIVRAGVTFGGVGAVNLGTAAAQCQVAFLGNDGAPVGTSIALALPARSVSYRRDAIAAAGTTAAAALRTTVRCDQPFFAFAGLQRAAEGTSQFVTPLRADDASRACTAGTVCYEYAGVVHVSTTKTAARGFAFDPPDGRYDRVTVHLEVEVNGWSPPITGAHGILYMIRDKNKDMFANVFLQGPGSKGNMLTLRHGFNQTHPQKAKFRVKLVPVNGRTYSLDYLYDTKAKALVLTVKGPNGQELMRITDKPNIANVDFAAKQLLELGLSNPGLVSNEPASTGWLFKNLHVELTPKAP
ncbi:MAG TPA: hypothetical protein VN811_06585 [Thermoanaerobaculia bacterium]|nr:hypothetical protein [Thermoanaerobaculia bacterium]